VFGIPGAHMYDFNDALGTARRAIRFITTRHEHGRGYMALRIREITGRSPAYTPSSRDRAFEFGGRALHRL